MIFSKMKNIESQTILSMTSQAGKFQANDNIQNVQHYEVA
jgi:hypothetical protein